MSHGCSVVRSCALVGSQLLEIPIIRQWNVFSGKASYLYRRLQLLEDLLSLSLSLYHTQLNHRFYNGFTSDRNFGPMHLVFFGISIMPMARTTDCYACPPALIRTLKRRTRWYVDMCLSLIRPFAIPSDFSPLVSICNRQPATPNNFLISAAIMHDLPTAFRQHTIAHMCSMYCMCVRMQNRRRTSGRLEYFESGYQFYWNASGHRRHFTLSIHTFCHRSRRHRRRFLIFSYCIVRYGTN